MAAFVPISARTWKRYKAESAALFKQGGVMMIFMMMSISSDLRSLYIILYIMQDLTSNSHIKSIVSPKPGDVIHWCYGIHK